MGPGQGSSGAFFMSGANGAAWATKGLMQAMGLGPVGMTVMSLATFVAMGIATATCLDPNMTIMLEAGLVRVSAYLQAEFIRTRTYVRAMLGGPEVQLARRQGERRRKPSLGAAHMLLSCVDDFTRRRNGNEKHTSRHAWSSLYCCTYIHSLPNFGVDI
jgi:hypothetical protein